MVKDVLSPLLIMGQMCGTAPWELEVMWVTMLTANLAMMQTPFNPPSDCVPCPPGEKI